MAEWRGALSAGYEFYEKRFFLADGTPGYYHDRRYPPDGRSAGQGVITFVGMTELMPNAKAMAGRVARWAINNLQDPAGFFYSKGIAYSRSGFHMFDGRKRGCWSAQLIPLPETGN